ncbi:MAG: carboxypeptidase regulatory-like domain-containing protein [Candidatus Accumulibacter sp.]|nr:carboxypeptidase regulatory-like domain-containing protein [Candidatus Accumulibacter conexus]
MTTIRVTSSATNAAGTAFGQQDDLLKPSYFDLYVTNSTDALLPDGTYDAYCLNPKERITVSPTTYTAQSYAGESEASYDPVGLAAITQTQVDRINWLLAQNFTWDPKFAGQFNYGEVQAALWTLLGFSVSDPDTDPWLNDNTRNTVLQGDIDFLVSAAQSAVASGQGVSPVSGSFSRVIDPAGTVQPLIVQLQSAKLGNFVWLDANANGVQDSGEAGIDGIVVKLYDGSGNYLASTITGDDHSTAAIEYGYYQFVGLQAGSYQVEFVTPGYRLAAQDVSTTDDTRDSDADVSSGRSQVVPLAVGESNQTIDAGVYQTASLGDLLWVDTNANGKQDDGATGISGQLITLIGGGTDGLISTVGDNTTATTTTGSDGFYQFTGLTPGVEYQVQFSKPTGYVYTGQNLGGDDTQDSDVDTTGLSQIVTLTSGGNDPTIDAGVFARASIGDRVWLDCDGDGVQDANEVGVADVTVRLINSTGAVERTTTTNYTGNYLFDNLQPGDYSIQVVRPDGYLFTLANQGTDDEKDSDADATTGRTTVTSLSSGESDRSWDAGLTTTAVCLDLDLTGNTNAGGNAAGNIRTISQAGLDVHASAFSRVKATGEWSQAYLGSYGGGLGVTDGSEGDGSNNTHTVDNLGGRDNYVLFEFDQTVLLDEAFLGYVVNDSDLQVWIGTFDRPFDNHLALNDGVLGSMSFTEVNTTTLTGARWADLNAGDHAGNVIVIAADTTDKSPEDMFKIEMLKLCTPACGLTARIGDRVWEDSNYNGIQDSGEIGIANVTVKLLDASGSVLRTTTTGSSGYYSFDVDPGSYKVQVVRPSGYHATKGNQGSNDAVDSDVDGSGLTQLYTVSGGQTNLTIDAGLYRKALVGDKVWDDMDHDNIQDASEPGIKGITVKLLNASGTVLQTKTTDAYGNYKFTDLNPGTYQLQFDKTNVQYYQYGQWNNMSNWKWAVKDVGSNDQIDSDVTGNAVDKTNVTKTSTFTLKSGQSDMSRDAGITPIVIDLDGNGIQTTSRGDGAGTFDLFGNGSAVASGWISGGDGFLAVDRNGDGHINGVGELFGGTAKGAGFAQLAAYDSNADGLISAADSGFADLRIWRDANGNRATDDGELMTLSEAGVISLDVAYTEVPFLDRQGNLHLERSSVTMADGRSADMTDVYFAVAAEDAAAAGIELPDLASLIEGNQAAPVSDAGWLFV